MKWKEIWETLTNLWKLKCARCGKPMIVSNRSGGKDSIMKDLKDYGWVCHTNVCPDCIDVVTDGVKMSDYSHGTFFMSYRTPLRDGIQHREEASLDKAESFLRDVITRGGAVEKLIFGVRLTVKFGLIIDTKPLPDTWEDNRPILSMDKALEMEVREFERQK